MTKRIVVVLVVLLAVTVLVYDRAQAQGAHRVYKVTTVTINPYPNPQQFAEFQMHVTNILNGKDQGTTYKNARLEGGLVVDQTGKEFRVYQAFTYDE